MTTVTLFWFRRDLRLEDNHGLFHALKGESAVLPIFIFDSDILQNIDNKLDTRVTFIYNEVAALKSALEKQGSSMLVKFGKPFEVFLQLADIYDIKKVVTNHDYEPYANQRDDKIRDLLMSKGIDFQSFKNDVIFEKREVAKKDGKPYTIFTPYMNQWKRQFTPEMCKAFPSETLLSNLLKINCLPMLELKDIGFQESNIEIPSRKIDENIIANYHETRDFPAIQGTSRLSVHLRFGTISVRKLIAIAFAQNSAFLNELIWREFYKMILWHYPKVVNNSFKAQYDNIKWRNNESEFQAWCDGKTGYPIVDAGMHELNATWLMHNRLRMITASFLTKHLLIDWRWGETYFANKLLDFELSSNNGGWQWAASSGCDAVPYFRIFNPALQTQKFDPKFEYINKRQICKLRIFS